MFLDITPRSPLKVCGRVEEYVKPECSRQNACYLFHAGFLLVIFFGLEDGGDMFLRNAGWLATDNTASYPRRQKTHTHTYMYVISSQN
jgi:hypothetical protein